MTERDRTRLAGCHPDLIAVAVDIITQMETEGTPIFIVEGIRTANRQHALYLQGRPGGTPGKIVTDKDGYVMRSDHQVKFDGYGHAFDFAFVPTKAIPSAFDSHWPWAHVGEMAEKHKNIQWGGHWKKPVDLDHIQLT